MDFSSKRVLSPAHLSVIQVKVAGVTSDGLSLGWRDGSFLEKSSLTGAPLVRTVEARWYYA